jgi:hypothetical protein
MTYSECNFVEVFSPLKVILRTPTLSGVFESPPIGTPLCGHHLLFVNIQPQT